MLLYENLKKEKQKEYLTIKSSDKEAALVGGKRTKTDVLKLEDSTEDGNVSSPDKEVPHKVKKNE